MSTFPAACPKCGAPPMHLDGSRPGCYMCDTLVTFHGVIIERLQCVERQRNQVVDALRWALDQVDDVVDLDQQVSGRAALESARATLDRVTGGAA